MISTSNTTQFATLTHNVSKTKLASGLAINTQTSLITGDSKGTIITDILFRSKDASNARNFDIYIGQTTDSAVQVSIPANSGNNGSIAIASLAALVPALFDLDLNGNRVIGLESGVQLYVTNLAALTADMIITIKYKQF
jgi:hypothetical protein